MGDKNIEISEGDDTNAPPSEGYYGGQGPPGGGYKPNSKIAKAGEAPKHYQTFKEALDDFIVMSRSLLESSSRVTGTSSVSMPTGGMSFNGSVLTVHTGPPTATNTISPYGLYSDGWSALASGIKTAEAEFHGRMKSLAEAGVGYETSPGSDAPRRTSEGAVAVPGSRWEGRTADAARKSINDSMKYTSQMSQDALQIAHLADSFQGIMKYVWNNIVELGGHYNYWTGSNGNGQRKIDDEDVTDRELEDARKNWDIYAQKTMQKYTDRINYLRDHVPNLDGNKITPPRADTPMPKTPGSDTPGGNPGGGGNPKTPQIPTPNPTKAPKSPRTPTTPKTPNGQPVSQLNSVLDSAKNALSSAMDTGKGALGQALDVAKQSANANGPKSLSGLPEGVLGLSPATARSAGAGQRGSTSGAGKAGAPKAPAKSVPTTPATPTSKTAASVTSSRAGLSPSPATQGGGGPASGGQGAAAGNKEHKANRALRSQRNGEALVDEAEAVVAVIGGTVKSSDDESKTKP